MFTFESSSSISESLSSSGSSTGTGALPLPLPSTDCGCLGPRVRFDAGKYVQGLTRWLLLSLFLLPCHSCCCMLALVSKLSWCGKSSGNWNDLCTRRSARLWDQFGARQPGLLITDRSHSTKKVSATLRYTTQAMYCLGDMWQS